MRNLIFDFGNVLVRFTPEEVYSRYFGNEAKSWWFLRHVASPEWRSHIDAGLDQRQAIESLSTQWPEYAEAIAMYRTSWREMLPGEMPGMRELLAELKQRDDVRLYGLTNWSMESFPEARKQFPILQMIDDYVVSGAEGLVKPDHRLFQVLLNRFGLEASDCTFIDDNEANVEAARALGMEAIQFRSADDLRAKLALSRKLDDAEVRCLERQGCTADNWSDLSVAPSFTTAGILRTHFHGRVSIGAGVEIADSHICDCHISDGCRIHRAGWLCNYHIETNCRIEGVGEMSFNKQGVWLDVMNENGGRRIGLDVGMTVGDAYLWARYRDREKLMHRFEGWMAQRGRMGAGSLVRNATAVVDGMIGVGCKIEHGVIAERFLLGENVHLEAGLRLNDSVVGDNSTLARGEVGCSLIFPAHEQHHNSSFLIASLIQGQSNVASGATIGSNHNGRTADGEIAAGRGFWPGLCVSLKHYCRFASYTLIAKGDYPAELNITLPFSLVNNNVQKNQLEVMPAYWWMYNMYAIERNRTKFASRDRRSRRLQHVEFSPLAPDTAEEIIMARDLLRTWTTQAYHDGGPTEVVAHGMERGSRKTVILKPGEAYLAYEQMLIYYAMQELDQGFHFEGNRIQRWVNIGGQLVTGNDADLLLSDIEQGRIADWNGVHKRLDALWSEYPDRKREHAYGVLCHLAQKKCLDESDWLYFGRRFEEIKQIVRDRVATSRQKDMDNEFRQTTFLNTAERRAVIGS